MNAIDSRGPFLTVEWIYAFTAMMSMKKSKEVFRMYPKMKNMYSMKYKRPGTMKYMGGAAMKYSKGRGRRPPPAKKYPARGRPHYHPSS